MIEDVTRRSFLALSAGAVVPKQKPKRTNRPPLPRLGEFVRYLDGLTEAPVIRVTSLASSGFLPPPGASFLSFRDHALLFASDRSGKLCPFTMDLHSGTATQLAQTDALDPASITLAPHGGSAYFLDAGVLKEVSLSNRKVTEIARDVAQFSAGPTINESVIVRRDGSLERLGVPGRVWATEVTGPCWLQPAGGQGSLFVRNEPAELWYVGFTESARPVCLAKDGFSSPRWSPDGRTVLFLREIPLSGGLTTSEIHEVPVSLSPADGGTASSLPETTVSRTSRFAVFSPNGDGSVFVGASRSRAQPSIILLVRSLRREMVLCEHRASNPALVHPCFSPDSQRVFFQSDFQGKPAIYAVDVQLLVEPTPS